jgi:hypothetical protein
MFFPRFEEEIFTTGEVRDSCIPISSQPEDQSMTWYVVVVVIVTAGLLLSAVAFFHYKTRRKQGNMDCCLLSSG